MLTSEDIDRMKYPEIGERFIEDRDIKANTGYYTLTLFTDTFEELCKFIILSIAEYTWPFIHAQFMIISIYVVYYL